MLDEFGNAELMAAFAEFLKERSGPKPSFRDLWVKYHAFGTTLTEGGRMRIKSWDRGQRYQARRLLEHFGDLPWDAVTLERADEYRAWRRTHVGRWTKRMPKAATINRELRSAQSCLSQAVKKRIIPRNPLSGMLDERPIHDRDFSISQEEFLKIVKCARPLLRYFLLLDYETGCRRDELRELVWSEVDLDIGLIKLPWHRTKGARDREIPLTTTARLVLDMIPTDGTSPYVFSTPFLPDGPISRSTLGKWFRDARDLAGVTGPAGQPIWLHTLRHTWATDGATNGVDIETLMSIGGWSDEKTARRYINIARRHREAGLMRMNERSTSIAKSLRANGPMRPKKAPAPEVIDVPEEESTAG
jgi:integrase